MPSDHAHDWKRTSYAPHDVDTCAWDYDDPESMGGHNGPVCLRCGWNPCIHCEPEALEHSDCPHPDDADEWTAKYHRENPDAE